jgi:hypothetical protein
MVDVRFSGIAGCLTGCVMQRQTFGGTLLGINGRQWNAGQLLSLFLLLLPSISLAQEGLPNGWSGLSPLQRTERVVGFACGNAVINDLVRDSVSVRKGFVEDGINFTLYENRNASVHFSGKWQSQPPPKEGDWMARKATIKNIGKYPDISFLAGQSRASVRLIYVDAQGRVSAEGNNYDVLYGEAAMVTFTYQHNKLSSIAVDCRGSL